MPVGYHHVPGFIQSRDPVTGALQWNWWTTSRKGEPGMETWPDESAHGTGQAWISGTCDAALNLIRREWRIRWRREPKCSS
jgi:alcohol dehydrogenase (cytochrome c)